MALEPPQRVALAELAIATFDAWQAPRDVDSVEYANLALRVAVVASSLRGTSWADRVGASWAARDLLRADCTYSSAIALSWSQLALAAERDGHAALAQTLREECAQLLRAANADSHTSISWAKQAARAVIMCDASTRNWFASLTDETRLCANLARIVEWREAGDVRWEALFDALESELESAPKEQRDVAAEELLRAGLPRAAVRHALRGESHPSFALLAALWRDELVHHYESGVEKQRAWGRRFGVDWTGCSVFAELAAAQHRWGDVNGAARTATEAYEVAARGEAMFAHDVSATGGLPTEVAAWFLGHLVPMEVARGHETEARALYARCLAFLETPAVGAKRTSARRTTWAAVMQACAASGWVDDAIALTERDPDPSRSALHDAAVGARSVGDVVRCVALIEPTAWKLYALLSAMEVGAAVSGR